VDFFPLHTPCIFFSPITKAQQKTSSPHFSGLTHACSSVSVRLPRTESCGRTRGGEVARTEELAACRPALRRSPPEARPPIPPRRRPYRPCPPPPGRTGAAPAAPALQAPAPGHWPTRSAHENAGATRPLATTARCGRGVADGAARADFAAMGGEIVSPHPLRLVPHNAAPPVLSNRAPVLAGVAAGRGRSRMWLTRRR
jgi:hypothetical protein